MADLDDVAHYWGEDLQLSLTGDLERVSTVERSQQRVLRRLMTGSGDYLFHGPYGGGLPADIGAVTDPAKTRAKILRQLRQEESVAAAPEPVIRVEHLPAGLSAQISFVEQASEQPAALAFNVSL